MNLNWLELKIPPVLLVIIIMVVMGLMPALEFSEFAFSYQNEVAGLIAAIGLLVIVAGVVQFRQADTTVNPVRPEETSQVVSSGIYGYTRNPMYLGMLIVLLGWFVYVSVIGSVVWLAVFVIYMNRFQIIPEEKMLAKMFGDEYQEYLTKVRRWL